MSAKYFIAKQATMLLFKQIHGGGDQLNRQMSPYPLGKGLESSSCQDLYLPADDFGGTFGMGYKFLTINRNDNHERAHLQSQRVW